MATSVDSDKELCSVHTSTDLDADEIKASLERGVLNIKIPKKVTDRPPPRKITVEHEASGG